MPSQSQQFLLTPELVPRPLWGRSVYRSVRRSVWDGAIRRRVLEEAGGKCEICAGSYETGMICHEVWHYDDEVHSALLMGFKLICKDCNFVHHFGKASTLGLAEDAVRHLIRVNAIGEDEARTLVSEAIRLWLQRSSIDNWIVAISNDLVARFPFLSGVAI